MSNDLDGSTIRWDYSPPVRLQTMLWEELSRYVDTFCAAWESPEPPFDLHAYLPTTDPHLRRIALTELIKVDLEYRWLKFDLPKQIEEYAAELPELIINGDYPPDLIYEEFHVRSQSPEPPDAIEYYRRFPRQAEVLKRLLGLNTNKSISTMSSGRREAVLEIGDKIDDFDVLLKLGQGAFAGVYLARQRSMQRLVALKVSRDKGSEGQTLAQLDHPNIVRVYDQRVLPDRKLRLMYMQHIPGGTLQSVVERVRETPPAARDGRLLLAVVDEHLRARGEEIPTDSPTRRRIAGMTWPQTVCWLGGRLATALEYAHLRGVLHRDIKPANVLLAADGTPKLADFNVSFSSKVEGLTPATFFGGSLAYMSPEQLEATNANSDRRPDELDGRSDLFSLNVMLWELLTGARPFPEDLSQGNWLDMLGTLTKSRMQPPPAAAHARLPENLPQGFLPIILNCLEGERDQRPANAGMLTRRLDLCMRPKAQALLHPRKNSWVGWIREHPFWVVILVGVIPNVILSYFNIEFNLNTVAKHYGMKLPDFAWSIILPVNSLAYPLGVGLSLYLALPVIRAVRSALAPIPLLEPAGPAYSTIMLDSKGRETGLLAAKPNLVFLPTPRVRGVTARLRGRCLWLGTWIAGIVLGLWCVSGLAIPWCLSRALPVGPELSLASGAQLLISQLLFGVLTATQVFFWLTLVCVRWYFPLLVTLTEDSAFDQAQLPRIERMTGVIFLVALVTPFVAMLLGIFNFNPVKDEFTFVFGMIAGLGFAGSLLSLWLITLIRGDLAVLGQTLAALESGVGGMGGSMSDSFWTESR